MLGEHDVFVCPRRRHRVPDRLQRGLVVGCVERDLERSVGIGLAVGRSKRATTFRLRGAAGIEAVMGLEERTVKDPFGDRCELCGTELTEPEINVAREAGGPFLCSVHAAEELPAQDDEAPDSQGSATGAAGPGQPGP
jgi:hypothetical protein